MVDLRQRFKVKTVVIGAYHVMLDNLEIGSLALPIIIHKYLYMHLAKYQFFGLNYVSE